MVDRATANSLPRTAVGHKQDDQAAQDEAPLGKLLANSGSEPGANASPLFKEPAARTSQRDALGLLEGGLDDPRHITPKQLASHRTPDPDADALRFGHSSVESGSLSFMR